MQKVHFFSVVNKGNRTGVLSFPSTPNVIEIACISSASHSCGA